MRRRSLLRIGVGAAASGLLGRRTRAADGDQVLHPDPPSFSFPEIEMGADRDRHVPPGYEATTLLRWGDPLHARASPFDPSHRSAEPQRQQFGRGTGFIGFVPLRGSAEHGLLLVGHGSENLGTTEPRPVTAEAFALALAAAGGSVVEISRTDDGWGRTVASRYTRRITGETPIELAGPAAGHPRLVTTADGTGRHVLGLLGTRGGEVTPWGTWLSCEGGIDGAFGPPSPGPAGQTAETGGPGGRGIVDPRFDPAREPNEPNRFGWVVEIDPLDPAWTPRKRTALGRGKPGCASGITTATGRYVVYLGEVGRQGHLRRFVTAGRVDGENRPANRDLLDEGALCVARFEADGRGRWLPLNHGRGALSEASGFGSLADVLVEVDRAGDLLGATPIDGPEDVAVEPGSDRVYLVLAGGPARLPADAAGRDPGLESRSGRVIALVPDEGDHEAETFRWETVLVCGDPADAGAGATFSPDTTRNGWFDHPGGAAVDGRRRLWIAGGGDGGDTAARAGGVWAVDARGSRRGTSSLFLRAPAGLGIGGACFTPDDETLFVGQQPAAGLQAGGSTARGDGQPPGPEIVAVTRVGGGKIG